MHITLTLHEQEEAQAVRMFEKLLDSAASAATAGPSQSQDATPLKTRWLGSNSVSSESSRTAAASFWWAPPELQGTQPDPSQQTPEVVLCRSVALSRAQVEEQCNDPKLMQCGLEKVVASDGSVEWVASHSKVSLQLHLTRRSRASALTSALPPPLRNVSSSREPSASSGTNTAWKSLRTSKAVALSRAVGERAVIPVGERTVIPRTICVARTNNPCSGRLWTLLHAGS